MYTQHEPLHPAELATHRSKMIRVTLVALSAAVIIFVVAILPTEFGIDPLRTGKSLGFSSLYQGEAQQSRTYTPEASGALTDTTTLTLAPGKGLEYKYQITKGSSMLFTWTALDTVYVDFHGEPTGGAKGEFESYAMGDTNTQHGTFVAPFTGTHGWYWKNRGTATTTITLTTNGYYEIVGIK